MMNKETLLHTETLKEERKEIVETAFLYESCKEKTHLI